MSRAEGGGPAGDEGLVGEAEALDVGEIACAQSLADLVCSQRE